MWTLKTSDNEKVIYVYKGKSVAYYLATKIYVVEHRGKKSHFKTKTDVTKFIEMKLIETMEDLINKNDKLETFLESEEEENEVLHKEISSLKKEHNEAINKLKLQINALNKKLEKKSKKRFWTN